jgi:hypothetical protein
VVARNTLHAVQCISILLFSINHNDLIIKGFIIHGISTTIMESPYENQCRVTVISIPRPQISARNKTGCGLIVRPGTRVKMARPDKGCCQLVCRRFFSQKKSWKPRIYLARSDLCYLAGSDLCRPRVTVTSKLCGEHDGRNRPIKQMTRRPGGSAKIKNDLNEGQEKKKNVRQHVPWNLRFGALVRRSRLVEQQFKPSV